MGRCRKPGESGVHSPLFGGRGSFVRHDGQGPNHSWLLGRDVRSCSNLKRGSHSRRKHSLAKDTRMHGSWGHERPLSGTSVPHEKEL